MLTVRFSKMQRLFRFTKTSSCYDHRLDAGFKRSFKHKLKVIYQSWVNDTAWSHQYSHTLVFLSTSVCSTKDGVCKIDCQKTSWFAISERVWNMSRLPPMSINLKFPVISWGGGLAAITVTGIVLYPALIVAQSLLDLRRWVMDKMILDCRGVKRRWFRLRLRESKNAFVSFLPCALYTRQFGSKHTLTNSRS